jgi:CRP/FNR family cyclic AMP-dependent transcriptional regulator
MPNKTLQNLLRPLTKSARAPEAVAAPAAQTKIAYLTKNELFHGMPYEELHAIECNLAMTTCEKGRIFFMPGETAETLFILKEGRVQLYRLSPDGRKMILDTLAPGTVFGEMSIIGQGMQNSFAEAVEPCVLCVMSRHDVLQLLQAHPETSLHLLSIVGKRLMDTEKRLTEFSYMDVRKRLAALLLRLREKSGDQITGYSHQDLADFIGTYRETVTQTLNQFKQAGLIDTQRKAIVIRDARGLEKLAGEP